MVATKNPPIRPPPQTFARELPHPSNFNSHAYNLEMRQMALDVRAHGLDNHPVVAGMRIRRKIPSKRSVRRWLKQVRDVGSLERCLRNNGSKPLLRGIDLFRIAFYRQCFPKCTHAELNAFLFNAQLADGLQERRILQNRNKSSFEFIICI